MKKLITILPVLVLTFIMSGYAEAANKNSDGIVTTFSADIDYAGQMITAAVTGDYDAGVASQMAREEKIMALELDEESYTFDDLMLLAKIIYAEAGSEWLSDEWKMCVGEVVLNRVASPEFPNTIKEVLDQPGQYYGANSRYFNNLLPSQRCVAAAMRLLNGERLLEPSVVFQANFIQGGGAQTAVYDKYLGWTYFCYSSKLELYL
ncbi:MAG: cell wall hydrolase [Oscillospiraceae bacterium]|nr:cell wall hydrolase [Oscillospiraceae bacterium]